MSHNILIIEDNDSNMKLARLILSKSGYHLMLAADAEKGLQLARSEHPDLILMDVQLPGINGLTATGMLKQNPATQDIPVIAFTASAMKGDREHMLNEGCDDYISKPIDYKLFLETVSHHLQ